jgi:hypothetical protein
MVKWAADNGYDSVSWTPGKVQAARYDLSKQVDTIMAFKRPDGNYDLMVKPKNESGQRDITNIKQDALADTVGKELADKIVAQPPKWQTYSGLDLQVGGEGMAGFYDKILPNAANKLGKKYGAKVGVTRIRDKAEADAFDELNKGQSSQVGDYDKAYPEVWSLPITDAMRKEVSEKGMPLFAGGKGAGLLAAGMSMQADKKKKRGLLDR